MTIQKAAADAIACQDGCNASGIARSMVEAMDAIRADSTYTGTTGVNRHPIVYLFLYKLMALNGHEPLSDWEQYDKAEAECRRIAASVPVASEVTL